MIALREGPVSQVLETAGPCLEELGNALRDRRVVIVPGNHDYQLAEPLLERRRLEGGRMLLEARAPAEGDPGTLVGSIAARLQGPDVLIAYPGIWLRPDVYAIHGHYLDCHLTVPRLESVAASLMKALNRKLPTGVLTPDHYEAVLAPIYAFAYSHAQAVGGRDSRGGPTPLWKHARRSGWERVRGPQGPRRSKVQLLGGATLVGGVTAMNLCGFGPFKSDLSRAELDRAGLRAAREMMERLEIDAKHIIFGHTHRAGPFGRELGWTLANGTQVHNTGSWVYSRKLIGEAGHRSPYWPGTCVLVGDSGAPEVRGFLEDVMIESA
jgi:hypothetical protein